MQQFRRTIFSGIATVAIGALAPAFGADIPQTGLMGHWKLDESSGNSAIDVSANHYNGLLQYGALWTSDTGRSALKFSSTAGTSGTRSFLSFPAIGSAVFPSTGSLAFWIKGSFTNASYLPVLDNWASRNHIFMRTVPPSGSQTTGSLQIALQDSTGAYLPGSTGLSMNENTWTHIALVWDSLNKVGTVYKNGAAASQFFWGIANPGWTPSGQLFQFASSGSSPDMMLDDIALYQRVLSPDEVTSIYAGTTPPVADTVAPLAPEAFAASALSPANVVVAWNLPAEQPGGYLLYRNDTLIAKVAGSANSYIDTNLAAGTAYAYKLYAFDASGNRSPVSALAQVATPALPLLFSGDLEANPLGKASLIPGWIQHGAANTISIVDAPTRAGGKAFKFDFNFSDWYRIVGDQNADVRRTEAVPNAPAVEYVLGKSYWTGLSEYLPADWVNETNASNDEVIWQFHGATDGPSGASQQPLSLSIRGDQASVVLFVGDPNTYYDPQSKTVRPAENRLVTVPVSQLKGKWTDWVIQSKFDYTDGYVRIWMNGVKVADYTGSTIYHSLGESNQHGPYLKFGDYKWSWGNSPGGTIVSNRTLYADEIRIAADNGAGVAASCALVKPGDSITCGIPAVTNVSMAADGNSPSVAKAGSVITVSFTVNQASKTPPQVTLAGRTANVTGGPGNTWRASITVGAADADGEVGLYATVNNQEGDATTTVTSVTTGVPVLIAK
ncbi:hypothetical protein GTP58_09485 [Duganella sp. CY15W]|uniref:heparin lyase I family protein n=1 Tax=Duganella sp. CY15W TaxID=2692172 RepID=UPI001369D6E0|nr:heparin lyase I family protein [Duganella sp. CY15W]MYM28554.1 hypothetical protein [Duganella sp. CY15W]